MSDALRSDRHTPSGELTEHDRDARVEDLLLAGLDYYFVGQYELAINVWTRVLFIDRGHARARAYIERARGALAERQREAEELLHSGAAAFSRGDVDAARELLTTAVERGAGNEEALALLDRLDRLGAPAGNYEPSVLPPLRMRGDRHHVTPPSVVEERSRIAWVSAGIITGLLLAASGVGFLFARGEWSTAGRDVTVGATQRATSEPLPVPGGDDIWLARARALHAKGRLQEALAALDAIREDDARRADANELRAAIQRALLAAGRVMLPNAPSAATPATSPVGPPVKR